MFSLLSAVMSSVKSPGTVMVYVSGIQWYHLKNKYLRRNYAKIGFARLRWNNNNRRGMILICVSTFSSSWLERKPTSLYPKQTDFNLSFVCTSSEKPRLLRRPTLYGPGIVLKWNVIPSALLIYFGETESITLINIHQSGKWLYGCSQFYNSHCFKVIWRIV